MKDDRKQRMVVMKSFSSFMDLGLVTLKIFDVSNKSAPNLVAGASTHYSLQRNQPGIYQRVLS
jgi:hypothetical protein